MILIPEIPYDPKKVYEAVLRRTEGKSGFAIVVVAEGAISQADAALPKKEYKAKLAARTAPSIAYEIAADIERECGRETRVAIPGHTQRGGAPCAYDRVFATQVGVEAGRAILAGEHGFMIADKKRKIVRVPLAEVAEKLKFVDPSSQLVQEAKAMGIVFGD